MQVGVYGKCKTDGRVEKYKARLVAKGFTQTYGVDCQETFTLVAKINFIIILLSIAVNFDWLFYQLHIKNVSLNGELEEEVFMDLPPGFEADLKINLLAFVSMFLIEMHWSWLALTWTLIVVWSFIMFGYDEGAKGYQPS
ncbi:Cysteine-rich RLK (receptor-like protein kinase) 8 [Cucumis melo var. makuwa]|uniref:Cysteine-rich RLK (Receptor-like protein kinase) 8 n=1 Tax=Cucumis melo var. makuwa TaxID=1194695 RepID=A0A5D3DU32_CUCMM|nr:Cysteine-rich RLK (receptor-like protein kinase) 8 [Cucumis melo var. makuwa]